MKNSHIEWTDHTFNPWEGCTKVSPGCAHCYAETRNKRFAGGANWGAGAPRRRTSEANWKQPLKWDFEAGKFLFNHGFDKFAMSQWHRPRVFCASLADWLDDEVPIEWLADLLDLIRRTPNLDWLLLTKRPQNWARRIGEVHRPMFETDHPLREWLARWAAGGSMVPSNVWIGTTVEDQQRADERIPVLLKIPAKVRFLSCEPLLGPVDLSSPSPAEIAAAFDAGLGASHAGGPLLTGQIHWVICGGESGPGARPMHPNWARSLRDQCAAAGVAYLFKQWGEWSYTGHSSGPVGEWEGEPTPTVCLEAPPLKGVIPNHVVMMKKGKIRAGRLLDGVEHNAFPEAAR